MKNEIGPGVMVAAVVIVLVIIVFIGVKVFKPGTPPVPDKMQAAHEAYLKSVKDGTPRPGTMPSPGTKQTPNSTGN